MAAPPSSPKRPHTDFDQLYGAGGRIPAPEAVEHSADTGWDLWSRVNESQDQPFLPTAPASLPVNLERREFPTTANDKIPRMGAPESALKTSDALDDAIRETRQNNRVCLRPERWKVLYGMLPAKIQEPGNWRPPPPIIGQAWQMTAAIPKRLCFQEHILWAHKYGALEKVMAYYRGLPETDWLHMGEE